MQVNTLSKPIFLAAFIGLLFTATLIALAHNRIINTQEARFLTETAQLKEQVILKIGRATETLENIAALFKASEYVDSDEFDVLSNEALRRHNIIDSILFLPYVTQSEKKSFETFMQESGYATYRIHIKHKGQQQFNYKATDYFPVKYIMPLTPQHATMLGEDFLSTTALIPYIDKAIETGKVVATSVQTRKKDHLSFSILRSLYAGNRFPETKMPARDLVSGILIVKINLNQLEKDLLAHSDILPALDLHSDPDALQHDHLISAIDIHDNHDHPNTTTTDWNFHTMQKEEFIHVGYSHLSLSTKKSLNWHDLDTSLLFLALFLGVVVTALLILTARNSQKHNRELQNRNELIAREVQEKTKELQQLSHAVEYAGESIIISNNKGIIEYVNPAFTKITGYESDEVIGKKTSTLKSGKQDTEFYSEMWDQILRGELWTGSLLDQHKNGSFFPTYMSIAPIQNEEGEITHFVAIQKDMSELENAEHKFRQSQKMESIGTLVGGIAHDFNNMMAGILGNIFLARKNMDNTTIIKEKLDNIESVGMRAADIVKQLLSFARKDMLVMENLELTKLLKDVFDLAQVGIQENINTSCDLGSDNLTVHGDATQLQQIMMNLINNARDAIEGKKDPYIRVSLSRYKPDRLFLNKYPDANNHDYAKITVSDNGCGLPKSIIDKVFEPFFTTKEVGKGTGLGLSMVYGSVQTHKGFIEIDSREGISSAFSIYLPIVEQTLADYKGNNRQLKTGQGETILLADDEGYLRETVKEVFNSIGYTVLSASNGSEAIDLFRKNISRIDLVILDVVMPSMGGIEAATIIQGMKHDIPFVFMTGYSSLNPLEQPGFEHAELIRKPFDIQLLSQEIRNLLDKSKA